MSITFLVPSYNSALTIEETIKEINNALVEKKNFDYEILIIDDYSQDESYSKIERLHELHFDV